MTKTIMIVDDEREFLGQLSEMLNLSGYETQCFLSGKEALKNIDAIKPHLVLLDLNMKGLDGYHVANSIKHNPRTETIPIIMITGDTRNERINRLQEEHAVERCLEKPVRPLTIIAEIEHIFAGT